MKEAAVPHTTLIRASLIFRNAANYLIVITAVQLAFHPLRDKREQNIEPRAFIGQKSAKIIDDRTDKKRERINCVSKAFLIACYLIAHAFIRG